MTKRTPTTAEREHWERVRALGCLVTGYRTGVTLHHAHSGSMADIGFNRGSTRTNHWLVIPIHVYLHSMGPHAIDGAMGVRSWENKYGTQVEHLDAVSRRLGYNVWERAGFPRRIGGLD